MSEARAGRFAEEHLLFYVAGIPTYVVMGELAVNLVLAGELPRPQYPDALARVVGPRWRADAVATLGYAEASVRGSGDVAVALANAGRGLIEAAHARPGEQRECVLNEKGLVTRAGLGNEASLLLRATDRDALTDAIERARGCVEA